MPHRLRPLRSRVAWLWALLAVAAGCAGPQRGPGELAGASPYRPPEPGAPDPLGYYLSQLDRSIARWTELKLSASNPRELRQLNVLERSLQKRTAERFAELLDVLEGGAPLNRQIAAVALGFAGDPRALSPLLAALDDRDPQVVQKALLGLGVLAHPDTPTAEIVWLLGHHADPWTRNNAAFALQRIVAAGAREEGLSATCRDALIDEEPGVRAQCASVLGMLEDPASVQPLGDLLFDPVNLVSAAAATSLGRIGRAQTSKKGAVARQLVQALEELPAERHGPILLELARLAGRNLGDDVEDWREWANRMP